MLIGEYQHSLDSKGRINFPAKLREDLGEQFVVTKGLDNCLFVYRMDQWKELEERTSKLPTGKSRQIQRFFFAGATMLEPDKQGRVLLPQNLREHAGLKDDVTIIGVSTRAEIWDTERWNKANSDLTGDQVADLMDELGF